MEEGWSCGDDDGDASAGRDEAGGVEDGFRVSVCLARWFGARDPRARALVWAARGRRVRWLAARVRAALRLRGRLALRVRGHLLPPAEPLALLAPDDRVEVIPVSGDESSWNDNFGEPASDEPAPAPAPIHAARDDTSETDDEHLREGKRRALEFLQEVCGGDGSLMSTPETVEGDVGGAGGVAGAGGGAGAGGVTGAGGARRRRRVRKRRTRSQPVNGSPTPSSTTPLPSSAPPPLVVRNEESRVRAARAVHALCLVPAPAPA